MVLPILEVTGSGVISSRVARDSTTNRKAACGPSSGGCITPFKAADPRNSYSLQFFGRLPWWGVLAPFQGFVNFCAQRSLQNVPTPRGAVGRMCWPSAGRSNSPYS